MGSPAPLVELHGVSKRFGAVAALSDVSLSLDRGVIHGLLGENGAGKSTLMNILYGLYAPDSGKVLLDGRPAVIRSPADSIRLGIGMVHQSSTLVDEFTAAENITLGAPRRAGSIEELRDSFGFDFALDVKVKELPAGVKQKIEITRALYRHARLLILDEPTTSLVEAEFRQLLAALRRLTEGGVSVILITHKVREVLEACGSATVLRKGRVQGTLVGAEMGTQPLVRLMFEEKDIGVTDSSLPAVEIGGSTRSPQPVLSLLDASVPASDRSPGLDALTLDVYGGEIVGVAAISGNGEKELAEVFSRTSRLRGGDITLDGRSLRGLTADQVFGLGLAYTPEDRIREAILPEASIRENVLLGHQRRARFRRGGLFVDWDEASRAAAQVIAEYAVATPDDRLAMRRLSGGNIQKTVIGRAFVSPVRVLVTHNPTSGLDLATVEFIFRKLVSVRAQGSAVLWINEDLDELLQLCDRIAVLHRGRVAAVFARGDFSRERIGLAMIGGAA
jgi:general nucleoside transport system ATP-binding protein